MAFGAQLIAMLNKKASPSESEEVKGWRKLWDADDLRVRLDVRRYLYDKRDGKAVQPMDHNASGPVQVQITTNVKMRDPHAA